jgi:hypothetical protein
VVRESLSVLVIGSFVVSYLSKCSHITFFAIWFGARMWVHWVVSDVVVYALVYFLPVRVGLKPLVAEFICIIFICYIFVWCNWVMLMSPQFFLISFLLKFNLFGVVQLVFFSPHLKK